MCVWRGEGWVCMYVGRYVCEDDDDGWDDWLTNLPTSEVKASPRNAMTAAKAAAAMNPDTLKSMAWEAKREDRNILMSCYWYWWWIVLMWKVVVRYGRSMLMMMMMMKDLLGRTWVHKYHPIWLWWDQQLHTPVWNQRWEEVEKGMKMRDKRSDTNE